MKSLSAQTGNSLAGNTGNKIRSRGSTREPAEQHSWGYAVAQLVEALCYMPKSCGFGSQWCDWDFSLTFSFRPHYGPGEDSISNSNK